MLKPHNLTTTTTTTPTTDPLRALVRSHLPPAALRALRLVNHAVRDELVDGGCTALRLRAPRPPIQAPATKALCGFAARLRSLTSLDARRCSTEAYRSALAAEDCDELAAALERLPSPAALTALYLGTIDLSKRRQAPPGRAPAPTPAAAAAPPPSPRRLAAAVARCSGLRALHVGAAGANADGPALAARCLEALLGAARGMASLASLTVGFFGERVAAALLRGAPVEALLPLRRLETLSLTGDAVALLPPLLKPGAAAQLASLSSLSLTFGDGERPSRAFGALWRAPFLPQLTRLEFWDLDAATEDAEALLAALPVAPIGDGLEPLAPPPLPPPPPLLRSIKALVVSRADDNCPEDDEGLVSWGHLAALLAACNPATLEALYVDDCGEDAAEALAERAGDFTALRRLRLDGRDFCRSEFDLDTGDLDGECDAPAAAWLAIAEARFAPLESLDIRRTGWLLQEPKRLAALLSAPWAASLVSVTLAGGRRAAARARRGAAAARARARGAVEAAGAAAAAV